MDIGYQVRLAEAQLANTVFARRPLGDRAPQSGPEVFSAFYGCPLESGDDVLEQPILGSWDEAAGLRLDRANEYFRALLELTDALIEAAAAAFIVATPTSIRAATRWRRSAILQELCIDGLERPREVRALVERVTDDFFEVFDLYHERLAALSASHHVGCGPHVSPRQDARASNDFSCMISASGFRAGASPPRPWCASAGT